MVREEEEKSTREGCAMRREGQKSGREAPRGRINQKKERKGED